MKYFLKLFITGSLLLLSILLSTLPPTANAAPTLGPIPNGVRSIVYARHTSPNNKCMEVAGGSTANGSDVIQWACEATTSDIWKFEDLGNGYYRIRAVHSNKCLDVSGASTANGADIIQWTCNGGNNQQWKVVLVGYGYAQLRARHSGKCADVSGATTANGGDIIQWTCNGGYNQHWAIPQGPS